MMLRDMILQEHSKKQCDAIVHQVGNDQKKFDELFNLVLMNEEVLAQRAAWPMSYCVESNPTFISKHWKKLFSHLRKPHLHDAVKRNAVRMLQFTDIPEKYRGEAMDSCFSFLSDPDETVAVKACSLTVLDNLSGHYPEIIPEIRMLIEDQLPHQTAGFRSRAKKLLAKWQKVPGK